MHHQLCSLSIECGREKEWRRRAHTRLSSAQHSGRVLYGFCWLIRFHLIFEGILWISPTKRRKQLSILHHPRRNSVCLWIAFSIVWISIWRGEKELKWPDFSAFQPINYIKFGVQFHIMCETMCYLRRTSSSSKLNAEDWSRSDDEFRPKFTVLFVFDSFIQWL